MHSTGLTSDETLLCAYCGKRASFLSPIGPLCTTDALLGAAFADWIPVHVETSDLGDREPSDR